MIKNKYKNKKVEIDGHKFDSIAEGRRYGVLKMLEKAKEIKDFDIQLRYEYIVNGKVIFKYYADFVVYHNDGSVVVEDVKGWDRKKCKFITTPVFNLKKKLLATQGVEIVCVRS